MPKATIWTEIRDDLETDIRLGRFVAGTKLPTEAELAARFGVNRHTVRRAIASLVEAGLALSRQGAGVFVTEAQTPYQIGPRVRFSQAIRATGRVPDRRYTALFSRPADTKEAEMLDIREGELVHHAEGLSYADGVALSLFSSCFPAARLPNLLDNLTRDPSITAAFAADGFDDYLRRDTQIDARAATKLQAHQLGIRHGAAVLEITAINICAKSGAVLEFGQSVMVGGRVKLRVEGSAPTPLPPAQNAP